MPPKYYSRSNPMISRDTDAYDRGGKLPSWMDGLENELNKQSVKSKKEDYALFDQINSIIGNKSKYSTVEEAVIDFQKRTGLYEVLQHRKQAAAEQDDIFGSIPELKTFIDNYVAERPGTSVDSVVHDLLKINSIKDKLPKSDDVPEAVKHYINEKITESHTTHPQKENDNQLGKIDLSVDDNLSKDNDPFSGCEPQAKTAKRR
jgi:hypothetical protein